MNTDFGFFQYIAKCADCNSADSHEERGFVTGHSYVEATKHLMQQYGDDLISYSLYALEPSTVLVISIDRESYCDDPNNQLFSVKMEDNDE